jgi:hypothetical protein
MLNDRVVPFSSSLRALSRPTNTVSRKSAGLGQPGWRRLAHLRRMQTPRAMKSFTNGAPLKPFNTATSLTVARRGPSESPQSRTGKIFLEAKNSAARLAR